MKYSELFETLYDEPAPTEHYLGRGAHYSVLRAKILSTEPGTPAYYWNFAVIWDEDHDTRIINLLEELYAENKLQHYVVFGERKGCFTAILPPHVELTPANTLPDYYDGGCIGDCWSTTTLTWDDRGTGMHLIQTNKHNKIEQYLASITAKFPLGETQAPQQQISAELTLSMLKMLVDQKTQIMILQRDLSLSVLEEENPRYGDASQEEWEAPQP